jgi:hypothetical protein
LGPLLTLQTRGFRPPVALRRQGIQLVPFFRPCLFVSGRQRWLRPRHRFP